MADVDLAGAQAADLVLRRDRDLGDDVRSPGLAGAAAGVRVGGVGMAGLDPCPGLDDDVDLLTGQRLDDVRYERHAALALG